MRALNDCIKEDKSKANKMFLELDYRKEYDRDYGVCYYRGNFEISFDKNNKTIDLYNDTGEEVFGNTIYNSVSLDIQELQAINEKCKELGWL